MGGALSRSLAGMATPINWIQPNWVVSEHSVAGTSLPRVATTKFYFSSLASGKDTAAAPLASVECGLLPPVEYWSAAGSISCVWWAMDDPAT
jgi:hypothetical protein